MAAESIQAVDVEAAARLIKAGQIVIIPTETVYGLAADARDESTVARLFQAKGRPSTNPIACMVADADAARRLCPPPAEHAPTVERLLGFWPGPLTLLFPHHDLFSKTVTAGSDQVGLRVPDHDLTRELLALLGIPLAVTSANRSGAPSPTTATAACEALEQSELVAGFLDGGPCRISVESSVVQIVSDDDQTDARPGENNSRSLQPIKIIREGALKIADFNDIGIRVLE